MHPQRITHQAVHAYGPSSLDPLSLPSPLYPDFPEPLGGGSKATLLPRPLPPYVQPHYILHRDTPMDAQESPPPSHRSSDRHHGHLRHPTSPPQLQQPQPRQAAAYTLFPPGHEAYNPAHVFPTQLSRAPQRSAHLPLDPWAMAAFTDNANAHPTEMQGCIPHIYESMGSHQQPLSPLVTTYHPTYSQAVPPKPSPTATRITDLSLTSFPSRGKSEGNATAENSPQLRSWGGAGSLDPATGVFSRAADHPRIRTAQACEKCRARKAKVCLPLIHSM